MDEKRFSLVYSSDFCFPEVSLFSDGWVYISVEGNTLVGCSNPSKYFLKCIEAFQNFLEEKIIWDRGFVSHRGRMPIEIYFKDSERMPLLDESYTPLENFFIMSNNFDSGFSTDVITKDLLQEHVKFAEGFEVNCLKDFILMNDFLRLRLGKEVSEYTESECSEEILLMMTDPEIKNFCCKAFVSLELSEELKSKLFKDVSMNDLPKYFQERRASMDFHKLPIGNKEYRDFIDTLTVLEFNNIVFNSYMNMTVPEALTVAKDTISGEVSHFVKNMDSAELLWKEVYEKSKNTFEGPESSSEIHQYICRSYEKTKTIKFLTNYFKEVDYFKNEEQAFRIVNLFLLHKGFSKWCHNPEPADYILEELSKLMGASEVITLLEEVSENELTPALKEWHKYVENYEDYREMPASWWITLVRA